MTAAQLGITLDDLQVLNTGSITLHGGSIGPAKPGCVEGAIGAAELAEFYSGGGSEDLGICFIGSLMFYLIKDHCYTDGNKRTGLGAALRALYVLGLTLTCSESELTAYCLGIADGSVKSSNEVVMWLSEQLVAADDDSGSPVPM